MTALDKAIDRFMGGLRKRNPYQNEFHQAVEGVVRSIMPIYLDDADLQRDQILERMTEPDRVISFRVTWETDDGTLRAARAWRVQFNHCLGPYKGGLRFTTPLTESILKFLAFEQTFKNSLTGLPMGGGKGGAFFNPKGKSDREIMRFCHSLMNELYRHIGEHVDVPAGDIGVGSREISYLFGQYKRLRNRWAGVMTGKGQAFGGSAVRKEATGYGCVEFARCMLAERGDDLVGKRITISGSGNVALYAAEKALSSGARVLTLSDSDGVAVAKDGLTGEQLAFAIDLKENRRGRISQLAARFDDIEYRSGDKPWGVPCDIAMPCATQNELDAEDAGRLLSNGLMALVEGANMPATADATERLRRAGVPIAPSKAANAGGVAVSAFEQTQNAIRMSWSREEVEARLEHIMAEIHQRCVAYGKTADGIDYSLGADRAAFERLQRAMSAYGAV